MGIFDDIANAFDPQKNVLDASVQHTGSVLDNAFDPNKNNVASTFNNFGNTLNSGSKSVFVTGVGGGINNIFKKNGILDTTIAKPTESYFNNTVVPQTTDFFNNKIINPTENFFDNKVIPQTTNFFDNKVIPGTNNFFNGLGGVFHSSTTTQNTNTQTITNQDKGMSLKPSVIVSDDKKSTDYTIPLIAGGVIIAFLMFQK